MSETDLSIVIVNYNGGALVERCLASINEHPLDGKMEVIVVDNASTDGSGERIAALYPWAALSRLTVNQGLAKAFNQGIAAAGGRYILSLDNDTILLPGALDALLAFMDSHPSVGAAGSRLFNPDMTIQQTARRFPSAWNAIFGRRSLLTRWFPNNPLARRYLMPEKEGSEQPFRVDWMSAAALIVRREAIEQVGAMDPDFFVYWVDADWCYRINEGGWQIYCVPASRIIHDENLRSGRRDRRRTRMIIDFHKAAYRFYRKHYLKSGWSPKGLLAAAALGARAGVLLLADEVKWRRRHLGIGG